MSSLLRAFTKKPSSTAEEDKGESKREEEPSNKENEAPSTERQSSKKQHHQKQQQQKRSNSKRGRASDAPSSDDNPKQTALQDRLDEILGKATGLCVCNIEQKQELVPEPNQASKDSFQRSISLDKSQATEEEKAERKFTNLHGDAALFHFEIRTDTSEGDLLFNAEAFFNRARADSEVGKAGAWNVIVKDARDGNKPLFLLKTLEKGSIQETRDRMEGKSNSFPLTVVKDLTTGAGSKALEKAGEMGILSPSFKGSTMEMGADCVAEIVPRIIEDEEKKKYSLKKLKMLLEMLVREDKDDPVPTRIIPQFQTMKAIVGGAIASIPLTLGILTPLFGVLAYKYEIPLEVHQDNIDSLSSMSTHEYKKLRGQNVAFVKPVGTAFASKSGMGKLRTRKVSKFEEWPSKVKRDFLYAMMAHVGFTQESTKMGTYVMPTLPQALQDKKASKIF